MALALRVVNSVGLGLVLVANGVWGRKIGPVSADNQTPFTPASWTFSIWTLIYALLIAASVAQFYDPRITDDWGPYFLIQCAGSIAWLITFTRRQTRAAAVFLVIINQSWGYFRHCEK